MPKDRRHKLSQGHLPSAKTASRTFAVPDSETEKLDQGSDMLNVPANDLLRAAGGPTLQPKAPTHTPTKKEKQQLKHERLLQRLALGTSPYSKSHNRRLKRKGKAALSTDMQSVQKALDTLAEGLFPSKAQPGSQTDVSGRPVKQPTPGLIGEGKGVTLSKGQRKKALELERLRQSAIIQSTEYRKNPFDTIRKHAQNSLLSHEGSEKS